MIRKFLRDGVSRCAISSLGRARGIEKKECLTTGADVSETGSGRNRFLARRFTTCSFVAALGGPIKTIDFRNTRIDSSRERRESIDSAPASPLLCHANNVQDIQCLNIFLNVRQSGRKTGCRRQVSGQNQLCAKSIHFETFARLSSGSFCGTSATRSPSQFSIRKKI